MTVYEKHGFKNRHDYLIDLSEQYFVDIHYVESLADLLGESEDFDGLVSAIQDII